MANKGDLSVRQLEFCRQFYRTYPIANTLRSQLNWSQYRRLIQIDENADLIIKRWEEHFNS